MFGNP